MVCSSIDGLEIIILSEEREAQIPYDITYMWNLKYDRNELSYKTETASQLQITELWLLLGRGGGEEWVESLRLVETNYYM